MTTLLHLVLLAAIVGLAVFNGQGFSPVFDPVLYLLTPFLRGSPLGTQMGFFYATSAFIMLMTFALAGIPAALYERLRGHDASTVVSMAIWLAVAALFTFPAYRAWQDIF